MHTFQRPFYSSIRLFFSFFFALIFHSSLFGQKIEYDVKVYAIRESNQLIFYADNQEILDMSVKMEYETEGLLADSINQDVVVIPARAKKFKVGAFTFEPRNGFGYSYSYQVLKGNVFSEHNDDYVYRFPYEKGKSVHLAQGYNGKFSHTGINALDFNMKEGSNILAARGGLVIEVKEDSNQGCGDRSCIDMANFVNILHDDGTIGQYVHLTFNGALVSVGDQVERDQIIGLCGQTGFASGPHLHFQVTLPSLENGTAIRTKFRLSKKRIDYPEADRYYRIIEN